MQRITLQQESMFQVALQNVTQIQAKETVVARRYVRNFFYCLLASVNTPKERDVDFVLYHANTRRAWLKSESKCESSFFCSFFLSSLTKARIRRKAPSNIS